MQFTMLSENYPGGPKVPDYVEGEFWRQVYIAHQNRNIGSDQSAKNADNAIEEFRKRLPQLPDTPEADAEVPHGNG